MSQSSALYRSDSGDHEIHVVRAWLEERGVLAEEALLALLQAVHAQHPAEGPYQGTVEHLRAAAEINGQSIVEVAFRRAKVQHALADLLTHTAVLAA